VNLSNVFLVPFFDFKGSGGIYLRPNLWMDHNRWNITGELRLSKNYAYAYPLGTSSLMDDRSTIKHNQFSLYSVVHRRIIKDFFLGGGIDLDYYYAIEEQDPGVDDSAFKEYGIGTLGKSISSGLSINLLRDSRTNSINPEQGFYTTLILRLQNKEVASDFTWSSLYFDGRKYFSFHESKHRVLAFWVLYWGTYGEVPYLNLPGTAHDFSSRTGRGYTLGRFRGKQMLYGESEYRFDISQSGLWGGVVFANIQSFTEEESNQFEYVRIGAGLGIRLKFDKESNTNLTLDFGIGRDSFNIRLNLGEVF
jgi:outer membrane protein assembly factor BamA